VAINTIATGLERVNELPMFSKPPRAQVYTLDALHSGATCCRWAGTVVCVWSDVRSLFNHLNFSPARILFKRLRFHLPSTKQSGNVFFWSILVHFEVYCKINHICCICMICDMRWSNMRQKGDKASLVYEATSKHKN